MELAIFMLVAAAVLTPQFFAITAWKGHWRWLAAAPMILLAADLVLILAQTAIDPTSHNLWPLELAMIALIGLPVVGVLWLVRLVAKA